MNQQPQSFDLSSLFAGMMMFLVVVGMTRMMGHFFEPPDRSRKQLPKPVAKIVTVPGGSHWLCAKCGIGLKPGEKVVKIGAKAYCVPCARGGNPNSVDSGSEGQVERIPISEEFEEFIRSLPFMPERGKPLPDYVYQTMAPEFVTSVMSAPVSGYGRELAEKVALDVALFLRGGNFEIVGKLEESGWSSEDIAYDAKIRHRPTNTEWDIEIWAPFDWRKPETYKDGYVCFLPAGERIGEERWEIMPGEEWKDDTFDLTLKGGEEAGRVIEEFIRSKR